MSTPFNAAATAYGNAAKLLAQPVKSPGKADPATQGAEFAKFLSESVQGVVDGGRASDRMALDLVNGKGDVVDVVTAISQTEIAMVRMVTIRDRVISAYEEIMRMPI